MSTLSRPLSLGAGQPGGPSRLLPLSAALLLAAGISAAAYQYPPPSLPLSIAAGVALLGFTLVAIARYDVAVALGFGLLGVVNIEPAPSDAIFAILIAITLATGRFNLNRVPLVIFSALAAFVVLNIFSSANAVDPIRAATYFSITLYLALFSLWLTTYVRSERTARIVLVAYLFAGGISTVLALGALLAGFPGSDVFLFNGDRARGLFKDANVFGPFLIPAALLVLEETLRPRLLRIGTAPKLLLLLLFTLGVTFSFSRAAWLSMAIGVVVVLGVALLRDRGGRILPIMVMLTALGIATAALVVATGQDQFLTERAGVQNYDSERFGAQEAGTELAAQYPLGVGPGQFEPQIDYSAHSIYIRSYAEQGPLGLVTIAALIGATLLMAVRNVTVGRSAYGLGSAALLGAWAGLVANSFFVDTLHWRHLWLAAALIWIAAMRPPGEAEAAAPGSGVATARA